MTNDEVIQARLKDILEYTRKTNELVGFFSFTMAIACVSTENPPFYALLSIGFLFIAWGSLLATYARRLKLLQDIGHRDAKPLSVLRRATIGVIGISILFLVCLGYLDKYGVKLPPSNYRSPSVELRTSPQ